MPKTRRSATKGRARRDPLSKALQVLRWQAESPETSWGVRQLAEALHMPPSTIHRILTALEEQGLVQSEPSNGRYGVGVEFLRLAWRATSRLPLRTAALPVMQQLTSSCDETSLLGVYNAQRKELMYVGAVESRHQLRYFVPLYEWLPIHAGAAGLAILAYLAPEEREGILRKPRAQITDSTITDRRALEESLDRIRRRGFAVTRGQRIPGAVGIAAPITGPEGAVLGAVGVTMPDQRFSASMETQLARLVVGAANDIAARLGSPAAGNKTAGRTRP